MYLGELVWYALGYLLRELLPVVLDNVRPYVPHSKLVLRLVFKVLGYDVFLLLRHLLHRHRPFLRAPLGRDVFARVVKDVLGVALRVVESIVAPGRRLLRHFERLLGLSFEFLDFEEAVIAVGGRLLLDVQLLLRSFDLYHLVGLDRLRLSGVYLPYHVFVLGEVRLVDQAIELILLLRHLLTFQLQIGRRNPSWRRMVDLRVLPHRLDEMLDLRVFRGVVLLLGVLD